MGLSLVGFYCIVPTSISIPCRHCVHQIYLYRYCPGKVPGEVNGDKKCAFVIIIITVNFFVQIEYYHYI